MGNRVRWFSRSYAACRKRDHPCRREDTDFYGKRQEEFQKMGGNDQVTRGAGKRYRCPPQASARSESIIDNGTQYYQRNENEHIETRLIIC
jgi:hypothetical protein